jgi:hypothetical protein
MIPPFKRFHFGCTLVLSQSYFLGNRENWGPISMNSSGNCQLTHQLKAARLGGHFLSERPEKCAPMAGGAGVFSKPAGHDETHGGRRRRKFEISTAHQDLTMQAGQKAP